MTKTKQQDGIDLLVAQHEEIKQLFSQISASTGDARREAFQHLVRLLAVHEAAEEELVHPMARRENVAGDTVVEARLHEEQAAKHALAELYDLGPENPQFDAKLAKLQEAVVAHADHEEHDEFPRLRQAMPADQLTKLASALRMAERTAPTRPHPGGPSSATGNILFGPPMAVFDRVRDLMHKDAHS